LVRFLAAPGGRYEVSLDAFERPGPVKDWTLLGMDTPGGPEASDPTCPPLPDTSTRPAGGRVADALVLATALAVVVLGMKRRHAAAPSGVHP
jgi:hypothetical protein